jgi:hypothetical protein
MPRYPVAILAVLVACGASSQSGAVAPGNDAMAPGDDGGTPADGSSSGTPSDATVRLEAAPPPIDPCVDAGTCPPGVWINVTPSNANLVDQLDCGNYGTESVQADPLVPGTFYTQFNCQGIWKSIDYGLTWKGPINTGNNGAAAGDAAGGITLAPGAGAKEPPVIYSAGIRGNGQGFWKSTNGGVDWTQYPIGSGSRQDYYPPSVDPYDADHLLMAGHEQNTLMQSTDGGQTWNPVSMDAGMQEQGGTGAIFFVDTGTASTTRGTWLWLAQQSGGTYGTWRTGNAGGAWKQVDKNEHPHGLSQIYQDGSGALFMAGAYSTLGWGVLRSTDYGLTWAHVGGTGNESAVFGMAKNIYATYGWAIGVGQTVDPSLEIAPRPGTGTWTPTATPASMTQGPAQIAVTSDGTRSIAVAGCWNAGLWRYMEP